MNKPLNEIGFKEFKYEIISAVKEKARKHFYFSQAAAGYYADYRPAYPEKTAGDFTICLKFGSAAARLTMYQETAVIPTVKDYSSFEKLKIDLSNMEA